MKSSKLTLREVVLFGVLGALTFALKMCMAVLPNIEPVSLLLMVFGAVFGMKALYPTYIYVTLEILYWGLGTWSINYLYTWPILVVAAILMKNVDSPWTWAFVSAVFGLMYGALCGIVDVFIGGVPYAISKWVSGIPFDITHCVGNFVMALLLFVPLRKLMTRLNNKLG